MGEFQGTLNSRRRTGMSYFGGSEGLRYHKFVNVIRLFKGFKISTWYKTSRFVYPSWGKSLWNYHGNITYSQRHEVKYKQIRLFRWKNISSCRKNIK